MATINPFQEPIDYSIDVKTPFEASLAGFKLGAEQATIRDAQQKRLLDQQAAQQAQARQTELGTRLKSFYDKKPEERNFEEIEQLFAFAGNKDQLDALKLMAEGTDKRRLDADKRFYAQVMLGLESEPTAAYKLLDDKILAEKDPAQKAALETIKRTAQTVNPAAAVNLIEPYTATIFGKDWYAGLKDARVERRAQDIAPSALQKSIADAAESVSAAEIKAAEAADTPARLEAEKELREAQSKKAKLEADYEERKQKDEINKRLADLNLTKAQTNKFKVETANLNTTGSLLKLDFDAAVKGLPLPSGKGGTVGTATEDERKAAGWLAQADNAYKNMLNAMYTKGGKQTGAQEPGFFEAVGIGKVSQSPERQKFNQASASLAEALLRAATGAGQNEAEVIQKIEELTPTFFDTQDNINQKLAAIPVYLDSLKARAGRAAPTGYVTPTKESVIAAKPFSVTVGGKVFNLPTQQALDIFINSDLYKKAAGNK